MTNVIVNCLNWLHGLFDGLLPTMDGSFSTSIVSGISYMANLVAGADYLIPVSDIFAILGIVVGIRITMFSVFAVNWLIRFFVV